MGLTPLVLIGADSWEAFGLDGDLHIYLRVSLSGPRPTSAAVAVERISCLKGSLNYQGLGDLQWSDRMWHQMFCVNAFKYLLEPNQTSSSGSCGRSPQIMLKATEELFKLVNTKENMEADTFKLPRRE